ncbi:MAG: MerR family DNA-binding transcriptional regulator [Pseudomonadota bacterium]
MASIPIGEVARRTGLAVSAIRYYEEMQLVRPERTAGGKRVFERSDIRRLSFVRRAGRPASPISARSRPAALSPRRR